MVIFLKLLDPLQWFVLLISLAGAVICLWSFIAHEDFKFIKASFFVYTLLLVCRYALIGYFRFDVAQMNVLEVDITNKLSTVMNMYSVSVIIVFMANLVIRENKKKIQLGLIRERMGK